MPRWDYGKRLRSGKLPQPDLRLYVGIYLQIRPRRPIPEMQGKTGYAWRSAEADRVRRLLWLSQTAYIDKIITRAGTSTIRPPKVPMRHTELLLYEGTAEPHSITRYQQKTGSILYAAVITRPDIAFAASRLVRFNTNPGPEHHKAADQVLHYLYNTRKLALRLGGADDFVVASDASFADNSLDRKSSQAYTMKLFGGLVGWRANKQDIVTTSITEAELLTLA